MRHPRATPGHQPPTTHPLHGIAALVTRHWSLLALVGLALGLRLLVWRWREFYELGGDEREYFQQALTLLQEKRYVELRLMRPPLYTAFLAGSIYLFDSLVQRLRLVQEVISALTLVPIYALALELFRSRWIAFVAGLLFALNYTLAATATELLTETVFLFGLTVVFWLLVRVANDYRRLPGLNRSSLLLAALAGLAVGALALVRSVALPLLPLGALWLLVRISDNRQPTTDNRKPIRRLRLGLVAPVVFAACTLVVILPWTTRNYLVYGAPILIDTTGAENLWLDNNPSQRTPDDPLGREAAKRVLYEMGEERAARQELAAERGLAEIRANPAWFVSKAWGEAKKFFALQYFDELREKRAIWVPPSEVWFKLLLGDGLWLVLLFGGVIGLWRARPMGDQQPPTAGAWRSASRMLTSPWLLFVPWALYILATSMIFHVELRYRLPLYPVLAPYAAWTLVRLIPRREVSNIPQTLPAHGRWSVVGGLLSVALLAALTLLYRPYPTEAWTLANKHVSLWQAEQALARKELTSAQTAAARALSLDDTSVLARVALARAHLLYGDRTSAYTMLAEAINTLEAHPHPHLLRGALLRADGQVDEARSELAFETRSLEDLQGWAWSEFASLDKPPAELTIGGGLDLGYVRDFHAAEDGFRWSKATSSVRVSIPAGSSLLELQLAPGRPAGAPLPMVSVYDGENELGRFQLREGWQSYRVPISERNTERMITLRSDTFRPRDDDPKSGDNRTLGVMVRRIAAVIN